MPRLAKGKHTYEVIVGNVGKVFPIDDDNSGNGLLAYVAYKEYVYLSKRGHGRVDGEAVTLMRDGEPYKEYNPPEESPEIE